MIAHKPLHGSGQAALPHPAFALGDNAQAAQGLGMTDDRYGQPAVDKAPHAIPKDGRGLSPHKSYGIVGYSYPLQLTGRVFPARCPGRVLLWQVPFGRRVRWWRGSGLRMMPTFPPPPLSFRTAGFPQYGWKVGLSGSAFPHVAQVKPAPGMPCTSRRFASTLRALRCPTLRPALCRNSGLGGALPFEESTPLPQRSSLRSGFYCPSPSTLTRPHPSHSQAHPDFAALRFIRDALAVLVRLGDPRVVPCFHCTFLLGMPSSTTTGSPSAVLTQSFTDDIGLRQEPTARHSQSCPSSASDGRRVFAASLVRFRYGLSSCSSPWRI